MNKEPAVIINAIGAAITEIIGLCVAFGIDVTPDQQKAILGAFTAIASVVLIIGPIVRQFVTPVDKANEAIANAYTANPATDDMPTLANPNPKK